MSTTTTPKPPGRRTPGTNPTPTTVSTPPANSNGAPNPSPSRMAAQTNSAASTVARARSVRGGTPLSARAAARKPTSSSETDDEAKAELQSKLDELQAQLAQAEQACEESRKHGDVLQIRLDEALREQGMLEESVHEHTERIEEMEMDRRENVRARRELEQIYEAERAQSMKEKELVAAEKEEMAHSMQRLKETLAQRELRAHTGVEDDHRRQSLSRTSSHRSNDASPTPESRGDRGQFAPPSSLQRSDSRSSSRLVLQKDKIIEGLRLELAEAQIKLVELENKGGGTLHQLEKDMYDIKMQNARLMEENESFQLLLSEKTLNGDLAQSDLLRAPSNTDAASSRPSSAVSPHRASLADELEGHDSAVEEGDTSPTDRRLQLEVNSLKDQNKALTLYINNIISRLLQHEQFEAILDKTPDLMAGPGAASRKYAGQEVDKELPPPPPPHRPPPEEEQPAGLLQRASSVLRRKPARPQSQIIGVPPPSAPEHDLARFEEQQTTVHENPDTAPSIPLGRASSVRAAQGGHRRSRSDWPAASVVTNMYRGPSSVTPSGPLSPGLSSPPGRGSPFFTAQSLGARNPSASSVPTTISETDIDGTPVANKENLTTAPSSFQSRDSKFPDTASPERRPSKPASSRNSVISNPGDRLDFDPDASNPSSPPRSVASSGEGNKPMSGAVMMGSKPRPLRLVQETQSEEEKARKAANRGSWFGWMNTGAGKPGGGFQ